ncbi:hypothetical protein PT974_11055 [Cladobotryum mycophilum]|uniref:C2H2-type domain-containing protein n=1 Tax=Cladobotryum mycophilum TaxID=491253 RepID=A0ABR0SBH8_9HYPO
MAEEINNSLGCTCLKHFANTNDLLEHLADEQQRARRLLSELQECLGHSLCRPPSYPFVAGSEIMESVSSVKRGTEERVFLCPHPKCEGTKRVRFRRRRGLVRHYATHVDCHESCLICGSELHQVSHYLSHFDRCKKSGNGPVAEQTIRMARRKRRALMRIVNRKMGLETSGAKCSNSENESTTSSEHISTTHQDSDPDNVPANFHISRDAILNESPRPEVEYVMKSEPVSSNFSSHIFGSENPLHDRDVSRSISAECQEMIFDVNMFTHLGGTGDAVQHVPQFSGPMLLEGYLQAPGMPHGERNILHGHVAEPRCLSPPNKALQPSATVMDRSAAMNRGHSRSGSAMTSSLMDHTMNNEPMEIPQNVIQTYPDRDLTANQASQIIPWQLERGHELEPIDMLSYEIEGVTDYEQVLQ